MKETRYKNILSENVGGEGNGAWCRTEGEHDISPIFSNFVVVAKNKTMNFCIIVDHLFPSFLHHHCLQILHATNFLRENIYIFLSCILHNRSRPMYMH